MSAVVTIALNTARGVARPKTIVWFVLLSAALLVSFFTSTTIMAGEAVEAGEAELAAELFGNQAVGAYRTILQAVSAVGFFLGVYSFPAERRQRSIVTVLARPVSRLELVAGKALGLLVTVLGMTLFLVGVLLLVLALNDVPVHQQFFLGVLQSIGSLTFTIALAVALGLHLRPLVAVLLPLGFVLLADARMSDNPALHYVGETFHALTPADPPRDMVAAGFNEQVLDLAYGLHLAVVLENVLYAATLLALSTLWFSRKDIRLESS